MSECDFDISHWTCINGQNCAALSLQKLCDTSRISCPSNGSIQQTWWIIVFCGAPVLEHRDRAFAGNADWSYREHCDVVHGVRLTECRAPCPAIDAK